MKDLVLCNLLRTLTVLHFTMWSFASDLVWHFFSIWASKFEIWSKYNYKVSDFLFIIFFWDGLRLKFSLNVTDSTSTVSSLLSIVATVALAMTSMVATLLTLSSSSLLYSGAISGQKSYVVSEQSRNLLVECRSFWNLENTRLLSCFFFLLISYQFNKKLTIILDFLSITCVHISS